MAGENGWSEYKNKIEYQLTELNAGYKEIVQEIRKIREDLVMLKVKSGLWGATAGFILSLIVGIITALIAKL